MQPDENDIWRDDGQAGGEDNVNAEDKVGETYSDRETVIGGSSDSEIEDTGVQVIKKRNRGRPLGSKNKVKAGKLSKIAAGEGKGIESYFERQGRSNLQKKNDNNIMTRSKSAPRLSNDPVISDTRNDEAPPKVKQTTEVGGEDNSVFQPKYRIARTPVEPVPQVEATQDKGEKKENSSQKEEVSAVSENTNTEIKNTQGTEVGTGGTQQIEDSGKGTPVSQRCLSKFCRTFEMRLRESELKFLVQLEIAKQEILETMVQSMKAPQEPTDSTNDLETRDVADQESVAEVLDTRRGGRRVLKSIRERGSGRRREIRRVEDHTPSADLVSENRTLNKKSTDTKSVTPVPKTTLAGNSSNGGKSQSTDNEKRGRAPVKPLRSDGKVTFYGTHPRKSLIAQPTYIDKESWLGEKAERTNRRNNIVLRRELVAGKKTTRELQEIIKTSLNLKVKILQNMEVGDSHVAELDSLESKKAVMANKAPLRGKELWIDDDLTRRQADTIQWIDSEVDRLRAQGKSAKRYYMKVRLNGAWWSWDERKARMSPLAGRFRERRGPRAPRTSEINFRRPSQGNTSGRGPQ